MNRFYTKILIKIALQSISIPQLITDKIMTSPAGTISGAREQKQYAEDEHPLLLWCKMGSHARELMLGRDKHIAAVAIPNSNGKLTILHAPFPHTEVNGDGEPTGRKFILASMMLQAPRQYCE